MEIRRKRNNFWTISIKNLYSANLFSHIIGQVDYDNYGVSGIEKYFNKELRDKELIDQPFKLTLDTNIQYLVNKELNEALSTFDATGAAALLLNVENGEILSLVSLPNFNINKRNDIKDKKILTKLLKVFMSLAQYSKHLQLL